VLAPDLLYLGIVRAAHPDRGGVGGPGHKVGDDGVAGALVAAVDGGAVGDVVISTLAQSGGSAGQQRSDGEVGEHRVSLESCKIMIGGMGVEDLLPNSSAV
jgi:hypothetical protein